MDDEGKRFFCQTEGLPYSTIGRVLESMLGARRSSAGEVDKRTGSLIRPVPLSFLLSPADLKGDHLD